FVIAAQAAIQWRVRAFYICATQAQQGVLISQKKVPLIDAPTLKALRCHWILAYARMTRREQGGMTAHFANFPAKCRHDKVAYELHGIKKSA
ncbi:hypothetical protein QN363_19140, partial [Undibacterium sp. CCC2.1]